MKKFDKIKADSGSWFKAKKRKDIEITNTTVISLSGQKKPVLYDPDHFMKCFRRQPEEEKRKVAMLIFSYYTRQFLNGEVADYIVEEHFNLLDEKYKQSLIDLLNDMINREFA